MASERRLLAQLAPELSEDMILRLVAAFQDLRQAYSAGQLTYPYSLRGTHIQRCFVAPELDYPLAFPSELINLVRHIQAYPEDTLEIALRNIFDFDVYRPETIGKLADILDHHGQVDNLIIGSVWLRIALAALS